MTSPGPVTLRRILGGSLIGSVAIGSSAILEYAYFLLAGYWLDPANFGLLSTATSILTILVAVATSGVGTSVAKFAAQGPDSAAQRDITSGSVLQLVLALLFAAVLLIARNFMAPGRWHDLLPLLDLIIWMMPVLALGAMLPLAFQGLQRLAEFGLAQIANVLVRLVAAVALLQGGRGAWGALIAYFPGALVTMSWCVQRLRPYLNWRSFDLEAMWRIARFSIPVSISTILITLFVRADVVFLKFFLLEQVNESVGLYTAPALLARSLFYLGCGLPLALLPAISATGDLRRVALGKILAGTALALGAITVVTHFVGDELLALFFPDKLVGLGHLLTPLMIATSMLTLAYIVATVLIALGHPGSAAAGLLLGFIIFSVSAGMLIQGFESSFLEVPPLGALGVSLAFVGGGAASLVVLGGTLLLRTTARPA